MTSVLDAEKTERKIPLGSMVATAATRTRNHSLIMLMKIQTDTSFARNLIPRLTRNYASACLPDTLTRMIVLVGSVPTPSAP